MRDAESLFIHFNHAGASPPTARTLRAITDHFECEARFGPMEAGARLAGRLQHGYVLAASLLGCSAGEIAFGTGHGQLYGDIVASLPLRRGDRILISRQEWIGNILALRHAAEAAGAVVEVMPADDSSALDIQRVKRMLTKEVKVVALTWVGASGPLVNPAAELGDAIREAGSSALYIVDASQVIGQRPIDVRDLQCDVLVGCGRKFLRGPRGTALAFVSDRIASQLRVRRVDDHSASLEGTRTVLQPGARAFEVAEHAVALRLGLIEALEDLVTVGVAEIHARLDRRAALLRQHLASLPGITLHDLGREKAAFVTFTVDGLPCATVKDALARRRISIGKNGVGYTPIDLELRGIPELLRASIHLETTNEHSEALIAALRDIAGGVRH